MDVPPHGEAHRLAAVVHRDHAGLEIEAHELLGDARHGQHGQGPHDVLLAAQHGLSVASVRVFSTHGSPSSATAARSDASSSTAAKRGVRSPCSRALVFSRRRSCESYSGL